MGEGDHDVFLCYINGESRRLRWYRSARRHKIGKGRALVVIRSAAAVSVPATAVSDPRLVWVGPDDRGIELEVVALVLPGEVVVVHVMPTALRRR